MQCFGCDRLMALCTCIQAWSQSGRKNGKVRREYLYRNDADASAVKLSKPGAVAKVTPMVRR